MRSETETAVALHDLVPAAGNREVEQTERDECAADHDRGLDDIGPDDGLDSAERGVDRGQNDDDDSCADVNPQRLRLVRSGSGDHFISKRKSDGGDVQARARCEQPCEKKTAEAAFFVATPKRAVRYS